MQSAECGIVMLFETDITVLTEHTATNKLKVVVKLTRGVIHWFSVYFPAGCRHTVRMNCGRGIHQVWPTNPDGYIKGNGIDVGGNVFHPMLTQPYEMDVYAWNVDAEYEHTITVRFWMKKVWQLMPFSDEMYQLALKEEKGLLP